MDERIYLAIGEKITTALPEVAWVDLDTGQLNGQRPAVAYPCCLVDVSYPGCRDINEEEQLVTAAITIKVAVKVFGNTSMATPMAALHNSLKQVAMVRKLNDALHGFDVLGCDAKMSRRSGRWSTLASGDKVFTLVYECSFVES